MKCAIVLFIISCLGTGIMCCIRLDKASHLIQSGIENLDKDANSLIKNLNNAFENVIVKGSIYGQNVSRLLTLGKDVLHNLEEEKRSLIALFRPQCVSQLLENAEKVAKVLKNLMEMRDKVCEIIGHKSISALVATDPQINDINTDMVKLINDVYAIRLIITQRLKTMNKDDFDAVCQTT